MRQRRAASRAGLGALLVAMLLAPPASAQSSGGIAGVVLDAESGRPLPTVDVRIAATTRQVLTSGDGRFAFTGVPPGSYTVAVAALGYRTAEVAVEVLSEQTATVELRLGRAPIALADLVVTPGHFGVAHERVRRPETLRRQQIERLPQLGEDVFRTVNRLPGMASNELKARFNVRGGDDESVLVRLDGLELLEPYHLKDFDGSLSILDVAAIGGVDLTTGGFSAALGNHLTGVLDLTTTSRVTPRPRTQLGLSLGNVRAMSQGSFADARGLWLVSARRGYLDLLLKLAGQDADVDPRYYDLLGKVVYEVAPGHTLSAHALHAGDRSTLRDGDGEGELSSRYGSSYGWLRWEARPRAGVTGETLLGAASMAWERDARDGGDNAFEIDDRRSLAFATLRQDWQFELGDRLVLGAGAELRRGAAEYDYALLHVRGVVVDSAFVSRRDSTVVTTRPKGSDVGLYLTQRVRPWQPLVIEAGLRWDRQSATGETQWSPRLGTALALGERTTLRLGWGRYAQPQGLHQLSARDGERELAPAERATQWVAGLEHELENGIRLRAEAYRRDESSLRPRYLNLGGFIEPVGEVERDRFRLDRQRGTAEGVEIFAQRQGERSSWMVSYALGRAEDVLAAEGSAPAGTSERRAPRPLEQRHTVYLDHGFSPRPGWQISWAWQFHTGWPMTPVSFALEPLREGNVAVVRSYGAYNAERLPSYHRLDLRASREVPLGSGRVAFFLDVFNVYNRKNPQGYIYRASVRGGQLSVGRAVEPLLPILPSFGVTWEF